MGRLANGCSDIQTKLKKDLEKETEQNRGDIEHFELLRKHYEEREKAYEVILERTINGTYSSLYIQEVQTAARTAVKDLAQFERQEIGLQEKRKHTGGRIKKLKKTMADVRLYHFLMISSTCLSHKE